MDKTTFKTIFFIRKFFLSPISYEEKPSKNKQIYAFLLVLIYTCTTITTFYYKLQFYKKQNLMQMTLRIISDSSLYFSLILPIIRIKKMTRDWWSLLKNVSQIPGSTTNTLFFSTLYLSFCFTAIFIYLSYSEPMVSTSYMKLFIFDTFQLYAQFFELITATVLLQMLKQCYQYQKEKLKEFRNLKELKLNPFLLNDSSNYFNQIFGWNILFSHIFGTCKTLIYIDYTI